MTSLLLNIVVLFAVNFLSNLLCALYLRYANENRAFAAAAVDLIHAVIAWGVYLFFLEKFLHMKQDENLSVLEMLSCAVGGATGSFFVIYHQKIKSKVKEEKKC